MGGRGSQAHCSDPHPRRRGLSPDPWRPAFVTGSPHGHVSPTDRSVLQRESQKSLNAGTATAQTAVTSRIAFRARFVRARRPQILPSCIPAPSPGDGSRLFVVWRVDWFKCDWKDRRRDLKINQRIFRRHRQRRLRKFHCRHFLTAPLRRSLSNYRRLLTLTAHSTPAELRSMPAAFRDLLGPIRAARRCRRRPRAVTGIPGTAS